MIEEVRQWWDWAARHKDDITLAIAILAFIKPLAPIGLLIQRRTNGPRLEFRLERGDSDEVVLLKIANVGARVASDVRLTWAQRSPMKMEAVPQPVYILPGEPLSIRFSLERQQLLAHQTRIGQPDSSPENPLGWLVVTYENGIRRSRTGRSIIPVTGPSDTTVASSVGLSKLPRRPFKERFGLVDWLERKLGLRQRREKRVKEQSARQYQDALNSSKALLAENGILSLGAGDDELSSEQLLGELGRRGWEWEFYPGDRGYETVARKRWFPSTSHMIRLSGETLLESNILVLAAAIEEDQRRGTDVGPFQASLRERDPLNFAPNDPRHDMDF